MADTLPTAMAYIYWGQDLAVTGMRRRKISFEWTPIGWSDFN
jgi:hypothetical protein